MKSAKNHCQQTCFYYTYTNWLLHVLDEKKNIVDNFKLWWLTQAHDTEEELQLKFASTIKYVIAVGWAANRKKVFDEKNRNNFESKGDMSDVSFHNFFLFLPSDIMVSSERCQHAASVFFSLSIFFSLFLYLSLYVSPALCLLPALFLSLYLSAIQKWMTMYTTGEHYANAAISMLTPPGNDIARMPQWFQHGYEVILQF